MLRHRSSLVRYFTLKTSGFGFLSVKGWFWPPDVLIYREDLVRTRAPATKKRPTGVDRFLFYGGPSGVQPAPQAAAASLRALRAALANAHAFTQLRAPTGSNPCLGNKKATNRSRSLSILWWAVRGSACSAGGRCGASRLARCAGKRSRVYSAPRPDGFEPVHRQQKSDQPELIAFYSMVGRQGFEPWTLGLKVPCSAS